MKKSLTVLGLLGAFLALVSVPSCDSKKNDPVVPQYDTTIVTRHDTIIHDTIRIDTVGCDTIIRDTTIDLVNDNVVCAYVAYYRDATMPNPNLLTHAIYSCAELFMGDDHVYQRIGLHENKFKAFCDMKTKNPDLKLMVSVAHVCDLPGNKQNGSFSMLSKDPAQRKHFADDCVKLCEDYNLDGIDINWELPGISESGAACDSMVDSDNFLLLMHDLRVALGPDRMLTYAGHTRPKEKYGNGWRFMDNTAAAKDVNWVNVMCYGMDNPPKPQNAVYATEAMTCCNLVWQRYNATNFPMDQFVMGLPFYTHQPADGPVKGEWYYKDIMAVIKNYPKQYRINRKFESTWHVPYVERKINDKWVMYGSFDDPQSIAYKGQWALKKGMKGIMWWENNGDDANDTLQKAVWKAMKTETITDTTFNIVTDSILVKDTIIITYQDTIIQKK